jgi:iron(III) transport system permease protein
VVEREPLDRIRAGVRRLSPAMLAAAVVVLAALLPLAYIVVRAAEGGTDAWSVLGEGRTGELIVSTAVLVGAVVALSLAVAVPLAWLVVRTDLPGRRVIGVAAALPLAMPSYVAALALLGAFGPRGFLQQLLAGPFGIERIPEIYGFPGALLALTLATYPYVYLLAVAALRSLDPALEEASRSLGRSPAATFRRVTLPMLRPALGAGSLLVALYTLSDFGAVSLMQYDALTRAIFLQYKSLLDRSPAAVLALVLVAFTAVALAVEARLASRGARHRVGPGAGRVAPRVALGRWRLPALGFCAVVLTVFLLVPLSVLGYWLVRTIDLAEPFGVAWGALGSSVGVAAAAAALTLAAALPVALAGRRHRAGRLLERAAYVPNALPGLVIALSLVFFAARYAGPVYQTIWLLLAAYAIRFLPEALAGTSSALRALSPRLEEAARSLGRSRLHVLLTVTLPLVRPGLAAGAALVFLSTMKELPATLLLRPIGFDTLATDVWKHTSTGSYSQAALPALLLVAASAVIVWLLTRTAREQPDRARGLPPPPE